MREPDTGFLHLLPDDRGVHRDMGRVDLHVARWMIAGRALSNAVAVLRCGDQEGTEIVSAAYFIQPLCLLKTPKRRGNLEITALRPYRRRHDPAFLPSFPCSLSAFVAALRSNWNSSPFGTRWRSCGASARPSEALLRGPASLGVALPDLATGLARHGAGQAGNRDPVAS